MHCLGEALSAPARNRSLDKCAPLEAKGAKAATIKKRKKRCRRDAIRTRKVAETAQEVVETCDVTFALEAR